MSLYGYPPTWAVPQPLTQQKPAAPGPWPVSYRFDPGTLDFAVDGVGRVQRDTVEAAAVQRAAKVMTTQRGAFIIYDRRFGVDLEGALRLPTRAATESALQTGMRQAIRPPFDQRISDAINFQFRWGPDNILSVSWVLVLSNGHTKASSVDISTIGSAL